MIKMPLGCEAAKKAIEICYTLKEDVLNNKLKWGLGPMVLKIIIDGLKLQKYVKHWSTVCSNHPNDTLSLFFNDYKNPRGLGKIINRKRDIPENMYCVHLWNKVIRENNLLELNKKDSFINYLLNI